ncbi:MAG: hypothetical protein WD055_01485 [Candidatus Dependentiae bacterium]
MQYLKLALLVLTSSLLHGAAPEKNVTIKDRVVNVKDQAVSKVSALLVLWSGTSKEDKLKRLDYYQKLLEGLKDRRFLKNWQMYKKRWYAWIVDGKMPIKNPDGRISDEKFIQYAMVVHELIKGAPLTQDEREELCRQELEDIEQYRKAKGIRS